jgi:surface antigen
MANAVADPAQASITSPDTVYGPGSGHLGESGIGGNPYPYGECTWYVWQFYADTQGIRINGQLGNATEWVTSAHREQWAVDDQPVPSKTVCWSAARYPPFGHVAVVWKVNGDGSFDVLEMNFTYYADQHPQLAGKIDLRTVTSRDGIQGFITPTGVTAASQDGPQNDLLASLATPFTSIGDAIRQAGLYLEAEAMTAEHKAVAMSQVALGTVLGGGGVALGVLTAYGRGRPAAGASRAQRQLGRTRRAIAPAPSPIGRRSYTETERRWLGPRRTRELAEHAAPSVP